MNEPELEKWDFQWYEDLFAKDANKPSVVKVASKAYRKVCLKDPGEYVARLTYNNGEKSEVNWLVRESSATSKAKNVIMFIGDGMTTNMITVLFSLLASDTNLLY